MNKSFFTAEHFQATGLKALGGLFHQFSGLQLLLRERLVIPQNVPPARRGLTLVQTRVCLWLMEKLRRHFPEKDECSGGKRHGWGWCGGGAG